MYLKDKIDELFEVYPNSFDKKKYATLNTLAKNEINVNYKSLSYRSLLLNGKVHELDFFKKYGTL